MSNNNIEIKDYFFAPELLITHEMHSVFMSLAKTS